MEYRGYQGVADYDPRDEVFYGRITNIDDLVTFEGVTAQNVVREFRKEVDRYIEAMRACEEEPRPSAPVAEPASAEAASAETEFADAARVETVSVDPASAGTAVVDPAPAVDPSVNAAEPDVEESTPQPDIVALEPELQQAAA